MNQPVDPIAAINEALRLNPNDAQLYNSLGSIYYKQGRISDAIPVFEKAIRLSPDNWESHYNLANCYVKRDMLDQAITHYNAVLNIKPEHENTQINLAMTYVIRKQFAQALPYLEQAAAREPKFAELQGHLAEAYLDLGKSSQALIQFEKATELDQNRHEWQHNLAVLYLREQQFEKAKIRFSKAIELNPHDSTATHMLNALRNQTTEQAPTQFVQALFDQYASYYNKHMTEQLEYKVPAYLRQEVGSILGTSVSNLRVLDLGCGTGLCGVYFSDLATFLYGVDLSLEMLQHAKANNAYDGLLCCDINKFVPGQTRQCFDVIVAADVLVYLGDLNQIFINAKEALSKQGLFAFTIENYEGQEYKLLPSGRFAHSSTYVMKIAKENRYNIIKQKPVVLRKNFDQTINGELFVLQVI